MVAAITGCAPQMQVAAFDPNAARVLTVAAAQVKRCYRSPRVASVGRQIVTRLRVRYAADGSLAGLPAVVSQSGVTPDNRTYAGPMAEAAIASVLRCSPLHLPDESYSAGWSEFDLTFSPSVAA